MIINRCAPGGGSNESGDEEAYLKFVQFILLLSHLLLNVIELESQLAHGVGDFFLLLVSEFLYKQTQRLVTKRVRY